MLLGFTIALRAAGVVVTHDRAQGYLIAAGEIGLANAAGVYHAGRATLCGSPSDLDRYDQVYDAYFDVRTGLPRPRPAPSRGLVDSILPASRGGLRGRPRRGRRRSRCELSPAPVRCCGIAMSPPSPRTRSTGWQPCSRVFNLGRPCGARPEDGRRAAVRWTRRARCGPACDRWASRLGSRGGDNGVRPRPVVLLTDVSGSMSSYADSILRLAHRITVATGPGSPMRGRVETFSVGTRLTPLTRAMQARDPERALVMAGQAVPDWSGGTRLGETLEIFIDRWGQRGMARGAVVVVFSDGWERGDPGLLAEQMARLHRIAHRVIWVNPHRGKAGYEPIQGGVQAVLPHVDDFVAGHSLAAFAEVLDLIANA